MWLVILIVVILLLRAIATSKTAANVTQVTKTVCSAPTAGDSFTQGNTIAAGVPEPPIVHCQHITRGPIVYSGLPIHVTYPIAPPPIKIITPAPVYGYPKPAPMPVAPIARPIINTRAGLRSPLMPASLCCGFVCGGFGGGSGRTCLGGGGRVLADCGMGSGYIISSY